MDFGNVAGIGALMVGPTLIVGAVLNLPRVTRAVRRVTAQHRPQPAPTAPPIERVAADLRRLVVEHAEMRGSRDVAMRAHHLRAIELAITDKAIEAALALDVPRPVVPTDGRLTPEQLGHLLRRVHAAGLQLPIDSPLFLA
jgi:hypothetical protein